MRAFYHLGESWFRDAVLAGRTDNVVDNLMIQERASEGGCEWEFQIAWVSLGDRLPVMKVVVFHDAVTAFSACHDLFAALADLHGRRPQPADVIALLKRLGFEDVTERVDPRKRRGVRS